MISSQAFFISSINQLNDVNNKSDEAGELRFALVITQLHPTTVSNVDQPTSRYSITRMYRAYPNRFGTIFFFKRYICL